jgi:hypothetical protein
MDAPAQPLAGLAVVSALAIGPITAVIRGLADRF